MTSVEEFFSRADLLSCVAVNLGSGKELAVCRLVNRAWYAALKSDHIWKEVYQRQLARPDEQEDMGWWARA